MEEAEPTPTKASETLKLELSPLHSPLRVGQWYSLNVTLKRGGIPSHHNGHLKIEAFQEDNKEPRELVVKDPFKLETDGNTSIVFKLLEATKVVDSKPKKTIIRVSLLENEEAKSKVLASVETHALIVFKFGLKVIEPHTTPYIFYKDKGGKDQGVELEIRLVDENDNLVVDKDILLMPILLYEGGVKVSDQSILTMSNDKTALRLSHGKTNLKFRINQVSTKHCNQKFCILITQAVRENDFPEVAPAISIPVDVRSKKNKRPNQSSSLNISGLSSGSNETDNPAVKRMRGLSEIQRSAAMLDTGDVPASSVLGTILASGEMYSNSIRLVDDYVKDAMIKMKEEIRWRQSGINRDSGEPLYEIRNPNAVIDRLLSSYERISMALNNLTRLRHLLDAFVADPREGALPIVKTEGSNDYSLGSAGSVPINPAGSGGNISQMTSLSSSLDIAMNRHHHGTHHKYLKPDFVSLRTASGESMDSHINSVVSATDGEGGEGGEKGETEGTPLVKVEGGNNSSSSNGGGGYDMLDMLATVANRNSKELLGSGKKVTIAHAASTPDDSKEAGKEILRTNTDGSIKLRVPLFENPIPEQTTNDNLNVTLIITEYVTVDNVIQGFPGLRFDANGALELLGFYRITIDKTNVSNFDENRIKEIGPTNSIAITNNLLKQNSAKEDNCEGQLYAVMDVIIKKEQPHDVRIEMWRYYHDSKPFHQPKVYRDKKLALKFHYWNPSVHSDTKKQKIEKYAAGKINSTVALVKQKANTADILAKASQRLVSCNVFGLII